MCANLIADLCDPVARLNSFVNSIAADVTPFELLDWYRDDMDAAQREAIGEINKCAGLEYDLRTFRSYNPLVLTDGPQAGKRMLGVNGIVDELSRRQYA